MHKIGIISDAHSMLRPEVIDALKGCELILHSGDINNQEILDKLEKSREHAAQGMYKDATEVSRDMRTKYGL